ncbi:MAG TPA: UDP-glucose/GDP-mannose dehydrogenase family protein [Planctomycetota bacterium]|nr:UDP-glucose/GDP-mannose dehydrogenase family protein [Planctomycetota bacterium]
MKIAIAGAGYVGLVAATCFAESGNDVLCAELDAGKLKRLSAGELTIYEPGLEELLKRNLAEGRLTFCASFADACRTAEIAFIAVGTPQGADGAADLSAVRAAAAEAARTSLASGRELLLVVKSTCPVGTNQMLADGLAREFPKAQVELASNPEFLKEGAAVDDFMRPDRVVVGVRSARAAGLLRELYEPFTRTGSPILVMDPASAEMAKYVANCLLASRISFINEMAGLAAALGADIDRVRVAVGADRRIGQSFLFPGVGYGGSCFPKDVRAMTALARKLGLPAAILEATDAANERQKLTLLPLIEKEYGGKLTGVRLALWGLAFKPRTDDVREAPALVLARALLDRGAAVVGHDPAAAENARRELGARLALAENPYEALRGADGLVLATEWNAYRRPDFMRMKELMRRPVIFDGRNIYDPARLAERGFTCYGIGRPVARPGKG